MTTMPGSSVHLVAKAKHFTIRVIRGEKTGIPGFKMRGEPWPIRHSLFAIRHTPFSILHSPYAILQIEMRVEKLREDMSLGVTWHGKKLKPRLVAARLIYLSEPR